MKKREGKIYLEVVKDEQGRLRLADRETGKLVAFERSVEVNVKIRDDCEDLQVAVFEIIIDDRMIDDV